MAENNIEKKEVNSASNRRNGKTITFTIPTVRRPKINWRNQITRQQAIFLLLVFIVGIAGGVIGGLGESIGYLGRLYTATTSDKKQLIINSNNLVTQISKKLQPSVVSIDATTTTQSITPNIFGFSQRPAQQLSEGTGIIISSTGLVLTNRHVVPAGTQSVSITLSNGVQLTDVSVVGRTSPNDNLDIAILKINNYQGQTFTPAVIGDSSTVQVGDQVVAIGNALGQFQNTVTSGIISGFGRNIQASSSNGSPLGSSSRSSSENLNDLFQTDAAINEGNSGGPLVNLNGQVIAVNTAIASNSQNIGFAIPINDVKGLISEVVNKGKFERPFLGIRYVTLTPSIAKKFHLKVLNGAYIPVAKSGSASVVNGSAAAKAGLNSGEVVTKVNNISLTVDNDLSSVIDLYQPGTKVKLTVVNQKGTKVIIVKLGVAPN